jgi:Ser/Thr protein kinase RdoA (MazF antagonist)
MPYLESATLVQQKAHNRRAKAITTLLKDSSASANLVHTHLSNLHTHLEGIAAAMKLPGTPVKETGHLGELLQALHEHARRMTAHPPLTGPQWKEHRRLVDRTKPSIQRASASAAKLSQQLRQMNQHWSKI